MADALLVLGVGSYAYGKEKRVIRYFTHSGRFAPVFVLSIWSDGTVEQMLQRAGFTYYNRYLGYLGRSKPFWTLYTLLRMPWTSASLVRLYRRHRCSGIVLVDFGLLPYVLPAILLVRALWGARLALYLGDTPAVSRVNRLMARVVNRLEAPVVAISEAVRARFLEMGLRPDSLRVAHNGIALADFDAAVPIDFRQRYGWPVDEPVFGVVGQVVSGKGIEDFVEAALRLVGAGVPARFVIVGRQQTEPDLVARVRARIAPAAERFAMLDDVRPVEGVYKGIDVLVNASRHREALSNAVLEAMASARAVVATRIGGMPEVVQDEVTGLLVPPSQPETLAGAMMRLARDAGLRARLGQAGRARVAAAFSIERTVREVDAVLGAAAAGT